MTEESVSGGNHRLLILAPFIASAAAAVLLMIVAIPAYGVASEFGYRDSTPVIGAYLYAVPVFIGSVILGFKAMRRTAAVYRIHTLKFAAGLIAVLAMVALTVAYVSLVNDPAAYRSDTRDVFTGRYEANLTESTFLGFSFLIAVFMPGGVVACAARFLYLSALEPIGLSKPAGVDPTGEIIRSQGH